MQNHLVWRGLMIGGVCLSIVGAQHAAPLQSPTPATALAPRDWAFQALNRLAYGPRPGEVPRVAAEGVMRWIDRQLSVDGIDDHGLAERERQFQILEYDRGDLAAMYTAAQRERRGRKPAPPPPTKAPKECPSPPPPTRPPPPGRIRHPAGGPAAPPQAPA